MKIFRWLSDNILFLLTLFLFAFIPLYPKRPLLDIVNTWVYVRVEDFVVVFVLIIWAILFFTKRITLRTPLTLPIFLFWIIGGIATLHGVLLIFPTISNVFPNVALLSYLRRIEYISLFFVGFAAIKQKRTIPYVVAILTVTLLAVVGYGFGQKFFGFPAFLTMNEEFAKGTPIQLSQLSRVPSTFAGHYDLAAYLVLIIPLLTSMIFGFRNLLVRLTLLGTVTLGFGLLFMTVSRVSFFVLLLSLGALLFFQKKRLIVPSLLVLSFASVLFLIFSPSLLQRFTNTVKEVNVLVDASTGGTIGHVVEFPAKNFENTVIQRRYAQNRDQVVAAMVQRDYPVVASSSAYVYSWQLPQSVPVVENSAPNGEDLPQGTGYINLPLSPVVKKVGLFLYQMPQNASASDSAGVIGIHGDFLIKRALAYDLSFTTRFQGEWPHAIEAFKRNIFLGSGYGSTSLAVDNNYFRMLGEVGLLGTISFFAIFLLTFIYIKKILPNVDSPVIRSFVYGFAAGVFGLALNAVLIDVFEASKVAFFLWLLTGVVVGTLHLYQKKEVNFLNEFKRAVTSTYAIIIYIASFVVVVFSSLTSYFFVGDDFTWLRWVASCKTATCNVSMVMQYFTDAQGFFYRPGTKLYFLMMYSTFWLNQTMYHLVSLFLHFIVAVLLFLLARKILKERLLAFFAAFLFLTLSGSLEAVFWISSVGFLFTAIFALLSLLFYITWREKNTRIYFFLSFFSIIFGLFFHELGIVAPLFILFYAFIFEEKFTYRKLFEKTYAVLLFTPVIGYLALRLLAHSHWFNGDYSYNLLKLPYNVMGNIFGYVMLLLFGPLSFSFYEKLRNFSREHMLVSIIASVIFISFCIFVYRKVIKKIQRDDKKIILFGCLFIVISLLPFLGLGNITSRYSYLASIGFAILFVFALKKLYIYLLNNGREIALSCIIGLVCIFSLIHLIQVQRLHIDWFEAGEKTKQFIVSIEGNYADYWAKEPMQFYFIDVPIRNGEAWILPVGLSDALWFTFRNDKIGVHNAASAEEAFAVAQESIYTKVFQFTSDGSIKELLRTKPQ